MDPVRFSTHHASVPGVALAVAEGGGQGGGAGFVITGGLTVVGGRVDADGPHAGCVAVAVAVVVGTAVARRPHVHVAEAFAALRKRI